MLAKFQIYGLSAKRKERKKQIGEDVFKSQFLLVLQLVYFNIILVHSTLLTMFSITSCNESLGRVGSKREIERHRVNNQHHKQEFVLIS